MMGAKLAEVGERLRLERLRLELNVKEFAEKAGIVPNSVRNYESGERPMNVALLLVLKDINVDIGYVVTGVRTSGSLGPIETSLLDNFSKLSENNRHAVFTLMANLAGTTISADDLRPEGRSTLHTPKIEDTPEREDQ